MIDLARELGVRGLRTSELILTGRALKNLDEINPTKKQYREYYKILEESEKKFRENKELLIAWSRRMDVVVYNYRKKTEIPNYGCLITPDGRCKIECLVPFKYGNLKKQSFAEVWNKYLRNAWNREEVKDFVGNINRRDDLTKFQIYGN